MLLVGNVCLDMKPTWNFIKENDIIRQGGESTSLNCKSLSLLIWKLHSNSAVYTCTICSQTAELSRCQTGKHLWAIYIVGFLLWKRSNPSHPITVVWRPPSWTGQILQCKFGLWHCSFVERSDDFLIQQCQQWGPHLAVLSAYSVGLIMNRALPLSIRQPNVLSWQLEYEKLKSMGDL